MKHRSEELPEVARRIAEKLAAASAATTSRERPDVQQVLRKRAGELAREIPPEQEEEILRIVEFGIGAQRLAFEAAWVQEVFKPRELFAVPGAPSFIAGVVNLRGRIVSVVDLRRLLGSTPPAAEKPRIVLLLSEPAMEFGILADRLEGAREVRRRELAPPPPTLPEPRRRYLLGVLPGAVSLLDARRLLTAPSMKIDQRDDPNSSERTSP